MQHPEWDDEMKFELFRFRSELKPESIKVLAEPLGLGLVRQQALEGRSLYPKLSEQPMVIRGEAKNPLQSEPSRTPHTQAKLPTASMMPHQSLAQSAKPIPQIPAQAVSSGTVAHWWHNLVRIVMAHLVDMLFVLLCLAMGLLVLTLMVDPSQLSWQGGHWQEAQAFQLLGQQRPWALVAGLYAVFLGYWLFFRLVTGATLGESCLHNFIHESEAPGALSPKASEES